MAPSPLRTLRRDPSRARLRDLAPHVRPHRRVLAIGMLLGLGATAAALLQPLAAKSVLDGLADDLSPVGPVLLLLALLVAGAVLGGVQSWLLGRTAERVVRDARMGLVDRMLRLRVSALSEHAAGDMVARVTSDATLLRAAATSSVVSAVNGVIGLVGAVVLMALIDLPLLAATSVALALVAVALVAVLPRAGAARRRSQEAVGEVGATLDGALRGIRTVKSSNAEDRERARIGTAADGAYRSGVRAVALNALAGVAAAAGMQLAFLTVLGMGAWRVSEGALEVSGLVAFLLYLVYLGGPISGLTGAATEIQEGLAALGRMREVEAMEAEPRGLPAPAAAPAPPPDVLVSVRGLVVRYGEDAPPALDGLDIDVPRRGHLALVGPSGAGKTTLFSVLLRFVEPDEGTVAVGGVPLAALDPAAVRARVAYVEQDTPLLPGTLRENLLYSAGEVADGALDEVVALLRLDTLVARLPGGLDADVLATTLSGGERQRIAIARALLRRPELILLDEVTAQLDALAEGAVGAAVREAAERCAVVTIAHRLSTVVAADRIAVLDGGRVRATGTHEELLADDALYRRLVETTLAPLAGRTAGVLTG